jgi:hypothetical protein
MNPRPQKKKLRSRLKQQREKKNKIHHLLQLRSALLRLPARSAVNM